MTTCFYCRPDFLCPDHHNQMTAEEKAADFAWENSQPGLDDFEATIRRETAVIVRNLEEEAKLPKPLRRPQTEREYDQDRIHKESLRNERLAQEVDEEAYARRESWDL